jgi:hypothetical protein
MDLQMYLAYNMVKKRKKPVSEEEIEFFCDVAGEIIRIHNEMIINNEI